MHFHMLSFQFQYLTISSVVRQLILLNIPPRSNICNPWSKGSACSTSLIHLFSSSCVRSTNMCKVQVKFKNFCSKNNYLLSVSILGFDLVGWARQVSNTQPSSLIIKSFYLILLIDIVKINTIYA